MRDKLAENSKKAVLIPRVSGMMFSFTDNKRSVFKCRQTHLSNSLKNLQVVGGGRAHYFNSEISKELHIAIRFFKIGQLFLNFPVLPTAQACLLGYWERDYEVAQAFLTVKKVLGPLRKLTDKRKTLWGHKGGRFVERSHFRESWSWGWKIQQAAWIKVKAAASMGRRSPSTECSTKVAKVFLGADSRQVSHTTVARPSHYGKPHDTGEKTTSRKFSLVHLKLSGLNTNETWTAGFLLPGPLLTYCSQGSNTSRCKPSPPPSDESRKCTGSTSQEFPRDLQKKMRQSPRNLNSEVKSFPPSYYLFNDKNMPLKK